MIYCINCGKYKTECNCQSKNIKIVPENKMINPKNKKSNASKEIITK